MVTKITTATAHAQNAKAPMAKPVVAVGHARSQTSQRGVTYAQNTKAPMAKRVVAGGHAWSQTSQLRPQMRKHTTNALAAVRL